MIAETGEVISGLDIHGSVTISAPNVTLKDCRITSGAFHVVRIDKGLDGVTVQNCEINGLGGTSGSNGITGQGSLIANNIYGVENGISIWQDNATIRDNYIHDLKARGAPHYDGIQIDGDIRNVEISHNTIINPWGQTSAVMIDNGWGAIDNIKVDNNLLVGGGFTVYCDANLSSAPITNVSFTNNHMGAGYYGIADFNKTSPVYTGNVNDGAALAAELK